MSDSGRLLGFGLVLAATLGAGYGLGILIGPIGAGPGTSSVSGGGDAPARPAPPSEMAAHR